MAYTIAIPVFPMAVFAKADCKAYPKVEWMPTMACTACACTSGAASAQKVARAVPSSAARRVHRKRFIVAPFEGWVQ